MKRAISKIIFILIPSCILMMYGCSKMGDSLKEFTQTGEIRYSKKLDSVNIFPGKGRAEVWMVISEPNIVMCKVFWNNMDDSIEIPVKDMTGNTDTITAVIDNISEGSYTFHFLTYDSKGNRSIDVDTTGYVYGDEYESNLLNRPVSSSYIDLDAGETGISWNKETDLTAVGSEIKYKTQGGDEKTVMVPNEEELTVIPERPLGDSIWYTTLYMPNELAIDTFYSAYKTVYIKPKALLLDKSKFVPFALDKDAPTASGYDVAGIWDGDKIGKKPGSWESVNMPSFPISITFDMGVTAKLDSIHLWQFVNKESAPLFYQNANIKQFEIWGSADANPDDNWDNWTKLGEFAFIKPSGNPDYDTRTDDDINRGWEGDQFAFPARTIPVRYIRIKVLSVWDDTYNTTTDKAHAFIQEMNLYGVPN